MRVLAIGDTFIPADMMAKGLDGLRRLGHEVVVRHWRHAGLPELQADNLVVEQRGANAVSLPPELLHDIERYDMVVVQFAPIGREAIRRAAALKYIGVLRAGTENVDADAARAAGAEIIPTPGRNARAVAEFTVGMILSEIRNIARGHEAMKSGNFRKSFPNSDRIPELSGKTVGLIGLGNIGLLVAKFLAAFDCDILVYDPWLDKAPEGIRKTENLDDLLARADVVSMHMRLTDQTRRMLGAAQLARMKPTAYLVNTARSGLIDEQALVEALREKRIAGAAIDVFDNEPLPPDSPIPGLDNITITPHMAGSTMDAFANTPKLFCDRFIRDRLYTSVT